MCKHYRLMGRVRAVPRLCELYPGICLITEEKARKNLSQGSRRVTVGTMKTECTECQDERHITLTSTECPTRYQTRHFFNNFTTNEEISTKFATHYRHALQTRYRHTLQTHSSSLLTQRMYFCSNFAAISSLVLESLKKCRVR
jgi:hypothetical protein